MVSCLPLKNSEAKENCAREMGYGDFRDGPAYTNLGIAESTPAPRVAIPAFFTKVLRLVFMVYFLLIHIREDTIFFVRKTIKKFNLVDCTFSNRQNFFISKASPNPFQWAITKIGQPNFTQQHLNDKNGNCC